MTLPCLREGHSGDDPDINQSPLTERVSVITLFRGVAAFSGIRLQSPSARVCGWGRCQMLNEAFCLFLFGMLLSPSAVFACRVGCVVVVFPDAALRAASCRGARTLRGCGPRSLLLEQVPGTEGWAFSDRALHPTPCGWVLMTSAILKRRIRPGCVLLQPPHTRGCQPEAGVRLPLIVWFLKPQSGQLLNASVVQTC